MNCVKCGAPLEEGSTSTLCAACQALETPPQDLNTEPTTPPVETPPEAPSEEPGEITPPVETPVEETPAEPEDTPDENQPTSGI